MLKRCAVVKVVNSCVRFTFWCWCQVSNVMRLARTLSCWWWFRPIITNLGDQTLFGKGKGRSLYTHVKPLWAPLPTFETLFLPGGLHIIHIRKKLYNSQNSQFLFWLDKLYRDVSLKKYFNESEVRVAAFRYKLKAYN